MVRKGREREKGRDGGRKREQQITETDKKCSKCSI
jgi:hypothetical protein